MPDWLLSLGINVLLLSLIIAGAAGLLYLLKLSASISVPFIIAIFLAMVFYPFVSFFDRFKIPRAVSSVIVLILLIAIVYVSVQITVVGIIDQGPAIRGQLYNGVYELSNWLGGYLEGFGISTIEVRSSANQLIASFFDYLSNPLSGNTQLPDAVQENAPELAKNLGNLLTNSGKTIANFISGIGSGIMGAFIFMMLFYYLVSDYENIETWVGAHIGVSPELGAHLVADSTSALRNYMKGTTIVNLLVAIGVGLGLMLFKVKLIIPIVLVTFIMGYIPFIGAIFSSLFAFVLAFASGGIPAAAAALIIVVVMQNVLQAFIQSKVVGDSLDMHPIIVLVSTIVGSIFAGLLGAMLATPAIAMGLRVYSRMKQARMVEEAGGGAEDFERFMKTGTFEVINNPYDSFR